MIELSGIPLPRLPTWLLSATHLVVFHYSSIFESGYIPPEVMGALLFAFPSLRTLSLEFQFPRSPPGWETRRPPPAKRFILPVLTHFDFEGATEYLEDFVAMIDAPQLDNFVITFFDQINYDTQRLAQFTNRTSKLGKCDGAHVEFDNWSARVVFGTLLIDIPCTEPARQLSSVAQVCSFSLLSTVEDLYIEHPVSKTIIWMPSTILYGCNSFSPIPL